MKYFIITVDTEGDNLWEWCEGRNISTENSVYIDRFQSLCEDYGFIPTYLTNYEMAKDARWVSYAKKKAQLNKCEIGLHIHAWNTPPDYALINKYGGNPYIEEYPDEIIYKKIEFLTSILSDRFEQEIKSARSGRWGTNDIYFDALASNKIFVDCSVIPQIDLRNNCGFSVKKGPDYRLSKKIPSIIYPGIIEIPMSTRKIRWKGDGSIKHKIKTIVVGEQMWLRPICHSKRYLKTLIDYIDKEEESCYLEFMVHSSELMQGGSPYFKTIADIDDLFQLLFWTFDYVQGKQYKGIGLSDFAEKISQSIS